MRQNDIEEALTSLRPSLTADGFDLRLGAITPEGTVEVVLAATPEACLDCLMPDESLVQVIETAIRRRAPQLNAVTLTKLGFDTHGG